MNMDAKDILGLPKTPLSITQERKSRYQKDSQRKPNGISREVFALTGRLAPLMPSIDVSQQSNCGADQDRAFVPDSISFGGDQVGKRDQKRKGPGRASETQSSPVHKRPKKFKASDL